MKIADLLNPAAIAADLEATDKEAALVELTDVMVSASGGELNRDDVLQVLQERERLGSTGIGEGVAIPHGKLGQIKELMVAFGRKQEGIDFDSMDGKPAHLFFLLVAPEESVGVHLKTLARISKLLKNAEVRERLLTVQGRDALYRTIVEEEEKLV
ncbi:MAG: PTS fructose transporter subunit IIA [Desulfuromonas sp.]|nr:MAG: PTS fructose transporter subunit IIA [Desulfuromonas sp.]